jgi:transposase InsO family protein/cytochrome c5
MVPESASERTETELALRSVRNDIKTLVIELGLGEKKIYELVDHICQVGIPNIQASSFLKQASTGGRGKSRLAPAIATALQHAAHKVCVVRGLKPGKRRTHEEIVTALKTAGISANAIPGKKAIWSVTRAPAIVIARASQVMGEHMTRVVESLGEIRSNGQCVQMDGTLFTCKDDPKSTLYILNDREEILGIGNAIFGVDVANRGIWTALGAVGASNSFLTGCAIHRGLLSKEPLLQKYGISGNWIWHGKPGAIVTDCGREFVAAHVRRLFDDRMILFRETCPKGTPHYRGHNERFNRTAHLLFARFLESDQGRKYFRSVHGKPNAKGILCRDYDRALVEWIVNDYHHAPHGGLGGASPLERFDDLANGRKGFRMCGVPSPVTDSPGLLWDLLWDRPRVINHIGIFIDHRRYRHPRLAELFAPGRRSSVKKISVRVNPYGMGKVHVRLMLPERPPEILAVPWMPDIDRLPMDEQQAAMAVDPSYWEWRALLSDLRHVNVPATEANAVSLAVFRENEAIGDKQSGAPGKQVRMKERANRAMREQFGGIDVPKAIPPIEKSPSISTVPDQGSSADWARFWQNGQPLNIQLLPTGAGGSDEY